MAGNEIDVLKLGSVPRDVFEQDLAASPLSPEARAVARQDYERARVLAARASHFADAERARQAGNQMTNPLAPVVSAAVNRVNTGAFGAPAKAASMLGAPLLAKKYDIPYWDAEKMARETIEGVLSDSPTGKLVGDLSAFMVPGAGPVAGVLGLSQRLASPLAVRAANAASRSRFMSGLLQLGSALTAGVTSAGMTTAGMEAVGGLGEEPLGDYAKKVIGSTIGAATSPVTVGLSAAGGLPAALSRRPVDQVIAERMAWAASKMPGLRPTVAETRPGTFGAAMLDVASNTPYGRRAVRATLDRDLYGPFHAALDELRTAMGISRNPVTAVQAASNVARRLPERLDARLKSAEGALGSALEAPVANATVQGLRGTVRGLRAAGLQRLGTEGPRDPAVVEAMGLIRRFSGGDAAVDAAGNVSVAGRQVTYQHLYNIMAGLDDYIDWGRNARRAGVNMGPRFSDVSMREAKDLRFALREALGQVRGIDDAIAKIRDIRQVNNAMRFVERELRSGTDRSVFQALLHSPDFTARWSELQKTLKPVELDVLRGGYLADLVESASMPRDLDLVKFLDPASMTPDQIERIRRTLFSPQRVNEMLQGNGPFSAQKIRTILGDEALEDLVHMSGISGMFMQGAARAEGSQTAGREAGKQVLDSVSSTFGRGLDLLAALPPRAAVYFGFTNSILNGRMAQFFQRMSSGEAAVPVWAPRMTAAVQGMGGLAPTITKGLTAGAYTTGGALQGLSSWARAAQDSGGEQ